MKTPLDVVLVDSGGCNLGSVQAALARLGVDAPVTGDWARIAVASHVILPGVGAAGPAMQRLRDHGLVDKLSTLTQPVLGVCVGVQLLFESSSEGNVACLGVLPGRIERLPGSASARIPHMGWNRIEVLRAHPLLAGLDGAYGYFVHSYAAPVGVHAGKLRPRRCLQRSRGRQQFPRCTIPPGALGWSRCEAA